MTTQNIIDCWENGVEPYAAAYWQKTDWNNYRLIRGNDIQDFNTYEKLFAYCQQNNIDAQLT